MMRTSEFETKLKKALFTSGKGLSIGLLLFCLTIVFVIWAIYAPLAGAIIASGWVVKEGRSQVVTHETGGVLAALYVSEGDHVEQGQVLAEMEDTGRDADLKQFQSRLAYLSILEVRLLAEQNKEHFARPKLAQSSSLIASFYTDQVSVFEARRDMQRKEKKILDQQIASLELELQGKRNELNALGRQREIVGNQVEMRSVLLAKGSISKVAMQNTQKRHAEIDQNYHALKTQIDLIPHRIEKIQEQIERSSQALKVTITQELAQLRAEKTVLKQRLDVAKKAAERVVLRSPVSGHINKLHINSVGSAVPAFRPMIEIVPEARQTLFEVEIRPVDIEQMQVGQLARLVLSSYDEEKLSPVLAKVRFISPDRQINLSNGASYFIARLELVKGKESEIPEITPGMPVVSYIQTSNRTFAEMLLDPIFKSVRRSFRG